MVKLRGLLQFLIGRIEFSGQDKQGLAHLDNALHGAHFCGQHDFADRFEQVVVAAGGNPFLNILILVQRTQKDDRCPFPRGFHLADLFGNLKTIKVGHDDVEQNKIRALLEKKVDTNGSGFCRNRREAHFPDVFAQQLQRAFAILDYKGFHFDPTKSSRVLVVILTGFWIVTAVQFEKRLNACAHVTSDMARS